MKRLTTSEFIQKARQVHGDTCIYDNVNYITAQIPVSIICRKHGKFEQLPYNHLRGWGCSLCNKNEKRRLGMDEFIKRSIASHDVSYDYSLVEYVNSKSKVKIICPIHGIFEQTPEKHMRGHCCPKCRNNYKDTTESFIEKAKSVHGDKYDYSKVKYVGEHTKVCIIDPIFGEFWQQPNSHLSGRDCYKRKPINCYKTKKKNGTFNVSAPENRAAELLIEKFGSNDIMRHHNTDVYPFACDFYIISLDLYIELNAYWSHGGHWFDETDENDIKQLHMLQERAIFNNGYAHAIDIWTRRDLLKRDTAVKNNLNYLVFWDNNLKDFMTWYNSFDETRVLKNI